MRALDIVDSIALKAVHEVHDAVAADYLDADRALAAPIPINLQASLATASTALVEQVYLDLWDDFTSGRLGDEFDVNEHHTAVMSNFNNRMLMTLRFMPAVPLDWLPDCHRAIADSYTARVRQLAMAGRGGFA